MKAALRTTPTLVQKINVLLRDRLSQLRREVEQFIAECRAAFVAKHGETLRLVFIFDQLEQIRSGGSKAQEILDSLCQLFTQHAELLRFPGVHLVYAVPPWLPFAQPGLAHIKRIPSVKCWLNDETRSDCPEGLSVLRDVLRGRLRDERLARLFGTAVGEFPEALEKILRLSGGDLRGLLRLAQGVIITATALPVPAADVDNAIRQVREEFTVIADDEARWLDRIGRERAAGMDELNAENVNRFTRFLDTYFVVCFRNGTVWYDLHPLVRDEVKRVMDRLRAREKAAPPSVVVP